MELIDIQIITNQITEERYPHVIEDINKLIAGTAKRGESSIELRYSMEHTDVALYFKRKGYEVDWIRAKIILRW
jgi:hypothetical protein